MKTKITKAGMVGKQKSMGQYHYEFWMKINGKVFKWNTAKNSIKELYEVATKAIIVEYERRKRASLSCNGCQYVGSGSCASCRRWLGKHSPDYYKIKRTKRKWKVTNENT
jgi:hypothetical protein